VSGGGAREPALRPIAALAAGQVVAWGVLYYAFAVVLVPMQRDTGLSTMQLTAALSLALLVSAVAGVPVGRWLDRHRPRALMTGGSLLASLLVIAWAHAHSAVALWLIFAALGVAMAAVLYEPAVVVARGMAAQRPLQAVGVLTLVAGLASPIFSPLTAALVERHGWRGTLVILAVLLAAVNVPLHWVVLRDVGAAAAGGRHRAPASRTRLLRQRPFWVIAGAIGLATFAVGALATIIVAFLVASGYNVGFAAAAAGCIGGGQIVVRAVLATGRVALPRCRISASMAGIVGGLATIGAVDGAAAVLAGSALVGAGNGLLTIARTETAAELAPEGAYGSVAGMLAAAPQGARALAPAGAGALTTAIGTRAMLLALAAGLLAAAAAAAAAERDAGSTLAG
jgi:predicted MFS family arabinose efflux permease